MAKRQSQLRRGMSKLTPTVSSMCIALSTTLSFALPTAKARLSPWSSAGKMGFRGSKKNTPYAAQMAAQDCAKVAYDLGLRKVKAYVKGAGQRSRIGNPHRTRSRNRSDRDCRCHSAAPQWMSSSKRRRV